MSDQTTIDRERMRAEKAEAELVRLREALRPFALFAEKWDIKPLRGISDEFYAIHAGEDGAALRLTDCRKARAALAVSPEGTKAPTS
jgi:hypothetical protein